MCQTDEEGDSGKKMMVFSRVSTFGHISLSDEVQDVSLVLFFSHSLFFFFLEDDKADTGLKVDILYVYVYVCVFEARGGRSHFRECPHTVWSLRMNDAAYLWGGEESSRCVCVCIRCAFAV